MAASLLGWKLQNKQRTEQELPILSASQNISVKCARYCLLCVTCLPSSRKLLSPFFPCNPSCFSFVCRVGGCGGQTNAFQSVTDSRFSPAVKEDRRERGEF